jgi:hypothetical protein
MTTRKSVEEDADDEDVIVENPEAEDSTEPSTEEIEQAARRYAEVTEGDEFPKGSQYPHAGNIAKKIKDHQGKGDPPIFYD